MSDRDNELLQMGNDIELITSYLNGHLDPERLKQVRRRLDDDPAFRDLAAPMLLTWSVPTHLERHPRPAGELEKHWDQFTKRARFVHQKRKARRRGFTILGTVILAVGLVALAVKDRVRSWYVDKRDFHTLAYAPGWLRIAEGREVQLSPGARLRVANQVDEGGNIRVKLAGTARFRTFATDSTELIPTIRPVGVSTRAGDAFAMSGEFTVRAMSDTTEVEVHRPSKRQFIGFMPMPNLVYLAGADVAIPDFKITEGQSARIVRGGKPVRLP